jgi:hypothetical protein
LSSNRIPEASNPQEHRSESFKSRTQEPRHEPRPSLQPPRILAWSAKLKSAHLLSRINLCEVTQGVVKVALLRLSHVITASRLCMFTSTDSSSFHFLNTH